MIKDEPDAELRTLSATIYDDDGALLAAATSWVAGMSKISKAGAAFANTGNLPIAVSGGGDGAFDLELTIGEVDTVGTIRVRFYDSFGVFLAEYTDQVEEADAASTPGAALLPAGPSTLETIRTTVRTRGDYLSSLTFTNTYVNGEIQASWAELYEIIADTHEGYWDKASTVSTVAAQAYIALPSDCWRVQGVDIESGADWTEMRQAPVGDRNRRSLSSTGKPTEYRLTSRGIELFPTPSAVYSIRVTYMPIVPDLDEEDGIQLYGWQEYVIVGTLLRLDQRSEKPLGERENELERQRQRVIRAASKRRQAEPEYLQMREGYGGNFEDMY